VAILLIVVSVGLLEFARRDVQISNFSVGQTPVTRYAKAEADGPVVVVAHGFAGSQQMMQGYALPLAKAGYRVFVFEFLGHGRNPVPMSGDVTSVDGTTRLLVNQTMQVIDAVAEKDGKVALLGHSMATDILVRVAQQRQDIGPVVLISAFSDAVTANIPADLLLIAGQWEPGLRAFAVKALQMVDPAADGGSTATKGEVTRRAFVAPFVEHVSVLQSRAGRAEAVAWLDRAYARTSDVAIPPTGWAILGVLAGLVLIFRRIAAHVPPARDRDSPVSARRMAVVVLLPAVLAPLIAVPLNPRFLPVLVADYLGLHLFVYGVLQLGLLAYWGLIRYRFSLLAFALLVPQDTDRGALQFAKGLSDADEPDLWQHDLTGQLVQWVEVGQPDERRLAKACGRAERVCIYAYGPAVPIWWGGIENKLTRLSNLDVWQIPADQAQALAALAQRSMQSSYFR
jgi:pimeloyl-ACP methyl ester carboxylesterase